MTTSKRLAAFRAAQPSDDEPETPAPDPPGENETEEEPSSKKEKPMTTETDQAALDTARADGFTAANARLNTVLASEHYAGREVLAKTLLANEKLGADEIVAALESAPKPAAEAPAASKEDGEDKARADMRDKLAANQPDNLGTGGDAPLEANHGWGKIHEELRAERDAL